MFKNALIAFSGLLILKTIRSLAIPYAVQEIPDACDNAYDFASGLLGYRDSRIFNESFGVDILPE